MNENYLELEKKLFLNTYNRIPVDISHGDGVHLISKDGTKYLDFFSGLGVNALGYNHPVIIEAVVNQLRRFSHLSNFFIADVQLKFAEKLIEVSGMNKVFLTNSGTESVEAAVKAIRKIHGPEKIIYSLTNSFHGRTYGALSLTDKPKYKNDFKPLLSNTSTINFNDVDDLKEKVSTNTAAVFVEFIQGEGGINEVSEGFVEELVSLRKEFDFAIVADSIQSGVGRTGKPFAFNHYNIEPDIVLTAKAIGGGLPLGAMLTRGQYNDAFTPGLHGTTFGGNPVSCAAGLAVLNEVFDNGLVDEVAKNGSYFVNELNELMKMFPGHIKQVKGRGFMIGVEMSTDCSEIVDKFRERKVLTNCTNKNVLRILPPLIAGKTDIDFFLYNFHEILKTL